MAEKVTLMRCLSKLKTTEKEIEEFLNPQLTPGPLFISCKKKDDTIVAGTSLSEEQFKANAKTQKDRIDNLILLQRTLKRKISEANNTIKVKIGNEEISITEAIFYKQTIEYKEKLLNRFKKELLAKKEILEKTDHFIEQNVLTINKQISTTGTTEEDIQKRLSELTTIFSKGLKQETVDPLDVITIITKIENEIRSFRSEIDYILNEANANNFIEL